MALFTWNASFGVGIPEVDDDHARLFALADEVHVALSQGAPGLEIQDRLASLIDHSRAHFAREEQLMLRHRYPDLAAHKAEHEQLTGRALRIQREFIMNGRTLTPAILRSLRNWLVAHIETADRRFAEQCPGCGGTCGGCEAVCS